MKFNFPVNKKAAHYLFAVTDAEMAALIESANGRVLHTTLGALYVIVDLNRADVLDYFGWVNSVVEPMRLRAALAGDLVA